MQVTENPFNSPDPGIVNQWSDYLEGLRKNGSSCGAIVEVVAEGIPAGLGAPVYGKLDADLAAALMSINAVKGVEIGAGMKAAELTGEENADEMRRGSDGKPVFLSNQAGGILGGISTGQPIVARFSVKPTSSILTPRKTIDVDGNETEIVDQGPPRSLRRYPRGSDRRSHGRLRAGRPRAPPPRTDGLIAGGGAVGKPQDIARRMQARRGNIALSGPYRAENCRLAFTRKKKGGVAAAFDRGTGQRDAHFRPAMRHCQPPNGAAHRARVHQG